MQTILCSVLCWIAWSNKFYADACWSSGASGNQYTKVEWLPKKVYYNSQNTALNVELRLRNIPLQAKYYEIKTKRLPAFDVTIAPAEFKDSGNNFVVFTCTAHCYPEEVLVLFQDRGSPEPVPLMIYQSFTSRHAASGKFLMTVTHNKTLVDADRDSYIFCGKRVISRDGDGKTVLEIHSSSINPTSTQVVLSFHRKIETVTPTVTVEPEGLVAFEPNTTMELVCSSSLVDGRILVWYEGDPNSASNKTKMAPNRSQNPDTLKNTIKLYLDESYNMKSFYCVQEHYFNSTFPYGEIARSVGITLQSKVEDGIPAGLKTDRSLKLVIAGACVAGALALLLAGLLVSRIRCRRQSSSTEEDDYVTPQVTYAVLALPETDSKAPKKPEKQNYVEIVGVYKNKSNNK